MNEVCRSRIAGGSLGGGSKPGPRSGIDLGALTSVVILRHFSDLQQQAAVAELADALG